MASVPSLETVKQSIAVKTAQIFHGDTHKWSEVRMRQNISILIDDEGVATNASSIVLEQSLEFK